MRALCWEGVGKLAVRDVPEPRIRAEGDIIVRVRASSVCGSDLHLLDGYVPTMRAGDVLGHEFMGEVVEIGPGVRGAGSATGWWCCSVIACGRCWYCRTELYSLCDNCNPNRLSPRS